MTITLANLAEATEQQIFDQVAAHMLKQNARSMTPDGNCLYRGSEGAKCAAGCLIADSEFNPDMDQGTYIGSKHFGSGWGELVERGLVPNAHTQFILKLQRIHDTAEPANWKEELNYLAKQRKLIEVA